MSVRATWIPQRTINVTVSVYNSGRGRMVRVAGPSGESGMAPGNLDDWPRIISWVQDLVAGELCVALGELDDEARKL